MSLDTPMTAGALVLGALVLLIILNRGTRSIAVTAGAKLGG